MFEFRNRVGIKICGVTRPEEALFCAAAGADLLGLNFSSQSPRCVSLPAAKEIVPAVRAEFPQIKLVGVFVDQERVLVRETTSRLGLDAVQLHGNETPGYAGDFLGIFVIKAFRVGASFAPEAAADYPCDAVLLDAWNFRAVGGTGQTFPWAIAAELRPRVKELILAGGLTTANVAEAIRVVRPSAIDVCSGVESAPGRKDEAAVRELVAAVARA
jgi:phosphoribosylanthranilate isomerase